MVRTKEDGTAVSMVTEMLTAEILTELPPGTSLPSEADLAARFAVSRVTVRESLKILAGKGLVDLGRGRRAVTREPDGSAFGDYLSAVIQYDPKGVFDLVEVRLSLEVQSVSLATRRISRPGLAAIESALNGMKEAAAQLEETGSVEAERSLHHYDVGFHEAIAMASGNRVLTFLFEAMTRPLEKSFFLSRRGRELRGQSMGDVVAAHQLILDRIRDGNVRGATDAMRAHLEDAGRDMRAALGATVGEKLQV